uniref:hypothetical protein n=1 Tax=Pedobacter schmidteae TaxID=2201271 RepID=UPI0013CF22EB|nr:hypothetical protein [Pedobacter schmidteae]
MKKIIYIILVMSLMRSLSAEGQTIFSPVGNTSYIGLDKNLLFNAPSRYQVTQTGTRQFNLPGLFDGSLYVEYLPGFDGNVSNDVTIEISGLPDYHTQNGAFIGFTTRGYPIKVFKIEGFDNYNGGVWRTIANVNDNLNATYSVLLPSGSYTKVRFKFSKSSEELGPYVGYVGLSELFFVHNEAAKAYDGLMVQYSTNGNVGIGTTTPAEKLAVNGKIRAHEIKVETANWPDYVFAKDYELPTLQETEKHIKEKGHLPDIPSAEEVKSNGIDLGEMNAKLLQKIEELTLHLIEKDREIKNLYKLNNRVIDLELKIEKLTNR